MARLLIKALEKAGFTVGVASTLRTFVTEPAKALFETVKLAAYGERTRITRDWTQGDKPDLWFTYHPYYKAPDLLGPELTRHFSIPYVTAEASYSPKRDRQGWADMQALVRDAVSQARLNLYFTDRDHAGLWQAVPNGRFAALLPFIDTAGFSEGFASSQANNLIAVAMMRKGDKLASFTMLSRALQLLLDLPWRLTIIGDGPARADTLALFAAIPRERIDWLGEIAVEAIPQALRQGGLYVWPGCGEAYGIAYLEAEAAGLPVVAQQTAGVPAVVRHGETGILTPDGDVAAYAAAIRGLLLDDARRAAYGKAARRFVLGERSLEPASQRLATLLRDVVVS
jgi:glycosyltransferase involved in cell wall biosynthesis